MTLERRGICVVVSQPWSSEWFGLLAINVQLLDLPTSEKPSPISHGLSGQGTI